METRKFKKEPSAWLFPKIVEILETDKISFTFNQDVSLLTNEEYELLKTKALKEIEGTIIWEPKYLLDDNPDSAVLDKNGKIHVPKPLYELEE